MILSMHLSVPLYSGEKGNPTYVAPEVAVKTTNFDEEFEIELVEEHSVQ